MRKTRTTAVDETSFTTAQPFLAAIGSIGVLVMLVVARIGVKRRVDTVTSLSDWIRKDIGSL
ncbi:hypothetical protein JNB88_30885 [Rhizobium cauense]|uniref:hypothetical protein n=1 Tax=Rhizobium cauense TaxID=1166683 RepID=UPI001C6E4493|nr:hypothetical protein [Rhizobium cauense]MBW9118025.1 hypothetical protein [Rhizobium cauense]